MSLSIAVIEDDSRYRRSLEMLFGAAPGFTLGGSYSSAEDALADLERATATGARAPWDLVLLDLDLPGMKGIEAAAALKRRWASSAGANALQTNAARRPLREPAGVGGPCGRSHVRLASGNRDASYDAGGAGSSTRPGIA